MLVAEVKKIFYSRIYNQLNKLICLYSIDTYQFQLTQVL